jgi:uncharacterized membrane protein (UPF0127 family)
VPARILLASGVVVADRVTWARGPWSRARGLLARPDLRPGDALVLVGGHQVHTFGMRHPIDVAFCDVEWVVRHVVACMPPSRITRWVARARYVIEAPCGALSARIVPGARLVVEEER